MSQLRLTDVNQRWKLQNALLIQKVLIRSVQTFVDTGYVVNSFMLSLCALLNKHIIIHNDVT